MEPISIAKVIWFTTENIPIKLDLTTISEKLIEN